MWESRKIKKLSEKKGETFDDVVTILLDYYEVFVAKIGFIPKK